jgi:polygalacturonase
MDYNILNYGAVCDGVTINTKFIQKAIDDREFLYFEVNK